MGNPPRPDYWARAKITHTMADSRRLNWEFVLGSAKHVIRRVLEIGSYEGQSALFWHHFFGADVTCIDMWQDVAKGCATPAEVEEHFDANIKGLPIFKIKSESTTALMGLIHYGATFDLIYVDGDHSRLQVMVDSCLAWRMLRRGGFMVWDDYREYRPDLIDRPTPAIEAFVHAMANEVEIIHDTGQQLFVRKS
jgi:predicted O-methyltransferase YrrM